MLIIGAVLWAVVIALLAYSRQRPGGMHVAACRIVARNGRIFIAIVPAALIAASFLAPLIPEALIGRWLGADAGIEGILIATLAGWCMPVPPVIFFPIVAVLLKAGAGAPQLTALVAAWNVFAFHRTLAMELPVMGRYFVTLRLASSVLIPPLAGLTAILLTGGFAPPG